MGPPEKALEKSADDTASSQPTGSAAEDGSHRADDHNHNDNGLPERPADRTWRVKSTGRDGARSCIVRKRLAFAILLVVAIVAVVTLVLVLFADNRDDEDEEVVGRSPTGLVPDSRFEDPASVRWTLRGGIIRDEVAVRAGVPDDAADEHHLIEGTFPSSLHLSGDGTRLAVGTAGRGHAYVYHLDDDDAPPTWELRIRLERSAEENALDAANVEGVLYNGGLDFGRDVALSGNGERLVVNGDHVVYTYDHNVATGTWEEHDQLIQKHQDADNTGSSLALDHDGNTLAVGAQAYDQHALNSGMVRIMRRTAFDTWHLAAVVYGRAMNDRVGSDVKISGDGTTVADGAPLQNSETRFSPGLVWVWRRPSADTPVGTTEDESDTLGDLGEWPQLGKTLEGPNDYEMFGGNVDLNTDGSVVAATSTGSIYVYELSPAEDDRTVGEWKLKGDPIQAPGVRAQSGICLSADGNVVVVGTWEKVYVFQYDESSWIPVGTFPEDAPVGDRVSCSADGRVVAIGRLNVLGQTAAVSVWRATED